MKKIEYICKTMILRHKGYCALVFGAVVSFSVMQLYLPVLLQRYIDAFEGTAGARVMLKMALLYLAVSGALYVTGLLKDYSAAKLGWLGTDKLRQEAVGKLMVYEKEFFYKNAPGQIVESMVNDLDQLERFLSETLIPLLVNVIYMAGILAVFYRTNLTVAIILNVFIVVSLGVIYFQQKKDSSVILEERKSHSEIAGFEEEIFENRVVIHGAMKEKTILGVLAERIEKRIPLKVELQKYYYRVWIITLSLLALANVLSLLIGGGLYFKHLISLGMVYLLYSYGNMLKAPFEEMQMHIQNFLAAKGSCEKLADILFYENAVTDGNEVLSGPLRSIQICDLSHRYDGDVILNHISLTITRGEKIGILGESGAGKSTLGKILSKLLAPQEGQVLINGIDIRDYGIRAIHDTFAYVTASNLLFGASVRDNLQVFRRAGDQEILEMLTEHGVLEYFTFLKGKKKEEILDTPLVKSEVSDGEAQLLNLCRLFFRKKELIIFDEAASMVDERLESAFHKVFVELTEGVTTIMITHDTERLADCDRIYRVEGGKMHETHI